MAMGTRVRVGLVGQDTGFCRIRIDLGSDEATSHAELVSKAADKLGVSAHDDISIVRVFLQGGDLHRVGVR